MAETKPTHSVPSNLKNRLAESYDAIAPVYNNWTSGHSALRTDFLNRLLDLIPSPDPVNSQPALLHALELGCGAGVPITSTLLSSPRGIPFHVTANDLSSSQLALAKESLGTDDMKVKWVEGDMMALSFPDESFDVIIALYSLIHLPREEQTEMMRRVCRWLKVGGLVLVNFGAEESEGSEIENWLGGWMYWSGWGAEKSLAVVAEVGLKVVRGEVTPEDGVDASFLWVVGKKTE
ncbi:methyltransferase domain-containing protein [Schizothecium vesticola]|uniref:Methyltransferase domain-containing protein n=1 Tax=Schizothecium vesticola TaxID=314040 RepID=A0AA40K8C7_9PEZI|nr:methyltransferase domain-containing protein [Schizothecium vesticola]